MQSTFYARRIGLVRYWALLAAQGVYPSPGPSPNHRGGELNSTGSGILPEDSPMNADLSEAFPPLIWGDRGG